jgi:hypothetical protein
MLINTKTTTKYQPRDVLAIKFGNGEEILATLVETDGTTMTVTKPVIMQLVHAGNGQGAVQFAPFMLGVDDDVNYTFTLASLLVHPLIARKDAASQYLKATSSLDLSAGGLI